MSKLLSNSHGTCLIQAKTSSAYWYKILVGFFKKLEFIYLELNYEISILKSKQLFISIYVDNLLFFSLDITHLA